MDDTLSLEILGDLQRTGIVPGLGRIRLLMGRLGHPERTFPAILITGTNGKGSTAAFIESILRAGGYRTGLFTSPHLVDVTERIRIDGKIIDHETFLALGREVRIAMEGQQGQRKIRATFFEALTAIGFLAFARSELDIAVVEVGMGGRLDSTNVCNPKVSVLTHVTLDHEKFLGATTQAITREKIGVARRNGILVTGIVNDLFDEVVQPVLESLKSTAIRVGKDFTMQTDGESWSFKGQDRSIDDLKSGLAGAYQAQNAAIAVATVCTLERDGFEVPDDAIRTGLATTQWPGRFTTVASSPRIILDGCHNPGAAVVLADTIIAENLQRPLVMVHATRPDKDVATVLKSLLPLMDGVVSTSGPSFMALGELLDTTAQIAPPSVARHSSPDLRTAVETAVEMAGNDGTVLITGSLYLVGEAMRDSVWESITPKG